VLVPAAWEQALQEILREAVTNAVDHGRAHTVTVRLRNTDGICLDIIDDGDGFDPSQPRADSSFGLISMRERTESLGGEFTLTSQPGRGTSVQILLP
jgi:signal transduction histidine kinase